MRSLVGGIIIVILGFGCVSINQVFKDTTLDSPLDEFYQAFKGAGDNWLENYEQDELVKELKFLLAKYGEDIRIFQEGQSLDENYEKLYYCIIRPLSPRICRIKRINIDVFAVYIEDLAGWRTLLIFSTKKDFIFAR